MISVFFQDVCKNGYIFEKATKVIDVYFFQESNFQVAFPTMFFLFLFLKHLKSLAQIQ